MKFKQFIMYSLKRGMLLSVSVPLFIASVLATILIVEHYQLYTESKRAAKLKNIAASMGTLIHEQQKERGATSVFLSSRGDQFGPQLKSQRALTDQAAQEFVASFEQNGDAANDRVYTMLSNIVETLSERDAIRRSVDTLFVDTPSALGHYTDHNAQMLSTIAKIGSFANNPRVASKVASLQTLLAAKEFAGIERAIGSGGFAVGRFDFQRVQLLGRLATRQSDSLARFETFAEDTFKADIAAIAALAETEHLELLREIASNSFQTGDLQGVTAKEFFDTTTVRIEAFKAAEDRLTASLSVTAESIAQSALTSVILLATAVLLSAAVSISVTAYVIRNMLVGVRQISDAADRLAKGDETAELPKEIPRELGRIVWSINFFKESVAKGKEREAEEVRERQQIEAAARDEEQQRQAEEKERAEKEAIKAREEQSQMTLYVTEVSEIVAACAMGDFSRKLSLEGREGVFKEIGEGLNTLVESVESGLSAAGQSLEKVANGDLTALMEGDFQGAFKDLQRNTNDMISALKSLIVDINGSTVNLSASSDELRDTSDALSKQAEQNAASLEETSAALEELTASIKQVSENVLEANNNASNASETAESSSVVASEAADAMNRIADASSEISNVVNVINDIAFQINLLALNAGVEAARAGEAGRGFSVVASEVRQLAQRAGEASTEIGSVITRSDQAVAEGVKKVNNAQVSLDMISESVIGVSQRIEEISTAISEQVNGIAEINSAVAQIDTNTQKQAASFEEVTATSALLSNEADGLKQSTARFKTGSDVIALPEKRLASTNEPSPAPKPMVRPAVTTSNLAEELDGWEEF